MSREHPWRNTVPDAVKSRMLEALDARMLCLSQPGPTSFIVMDPEQNRKK